MANENGKVERPVVVVVDDEEESVRVITAIIEDGTRQLADRLRRAVEDIRMEISPAQVLKVTTNIGVSACEGQDVPSTAEIVRRADEAMYFAKKTGRNCVVTWTEFKQKLKIKPQSVFVMKGEGEGGQ